MAKRSKRTSSRKRMATAKKKARPRARKPASLSSKIAGALGSVFHVFEDTRRMRDKLSRRGDSETE